METIKIWFADFWPEWNYENFITPILEKRFKVVLDEHDPDVLFYSIFNSVSNTPNYKCKKVLFIAENIHNVLYNDWVKKNINRALSIADVTIGFDPHLKNHYRLPLWQAYLILKPKLKERLYNRVNWKEEEYKKWCAFIVSNPANMLRNGAFYELNDYKHVSSYGKVFRNDQSLMKASEGRYWRDAKDEFFLSVPHKFMVTYENSYNHYYCTEKLMDAFLVGAMPIYWGDLKVKEDWNENAFINVTKQNLDIVKIIDQDKNLFKNMYEEPVFTDEQKKKHEDNMNNFEEWLIEKILQ